MKFFYQYRTRDNIRHDGEISASTLDDAYAALKAKGIRPGRVVEAPGFLNKLLGKGKRWMAIAVLVVVAVSLALLLWDAEEAVAEATFTPSDQYIALANKAQEIVDAATNDVRAAREKVKSLFRERYPGLSPTKRERGEAEALYGRISFALDNLEAQEHVEKLSESQNSLLTPE